MWQFFPSSWRTTAGERRSRDEPIPDVATLDGDLCDGETTTDVEWSHSVRPRNAWDVDDGFGMTAKGGSGDVAGEGGRAFEVGGVAMGVTVRYEEVR